MRSFVAVLHSCAPLLLLALFSSGCDCSGETPARRCSSARDCRTGETCLDGVCRGPDERDAGRVDTGVGADCVDGDGDGRGVGCAAGPDCDDTDPGRGGPEVCDGDDDDCDGMTDEFLADICVECTPECGVTEAPGPGGWMPTEDNSEGVIVDSGGALTLGRVEAASFSVWVANMNDGTVSKLDSRTGMELARYPTISSTAPAGVRPWNEPCNFMDTGNCPSRTAVDQNFDAYVANRAFAHQGTLTKFANREDDCVDRSGDGIIQTSRDLNGDGVIDMNPAAGEFVGVDDECILWTVPVGDTNGVPRALAIGLAPPDALVGDVWVGLYSAEQACRLSPADGRSLGCISTMGMNTYGAVADAMNRIWFVDRSGERREILAYVDPDAMSWNYVSPVPASACPTGELQSYGVTVDGSGLVYIASSNCEPSLLRYNPATDTWDQYSVPGGGTPRGLAADETSLWIGISHRTIRFAGGDGNRVVQLSLADMSLVRDWTIPTGTIPVGVGVSFDGSVWAVCQGTNSAARLDPAAGTWIEHGVGLTPYTYSDFIGFGLNVFAEPRGRYRFRVEGCGGGVSRWLGARVEAEIPAGTEVSIWARSADDIAGLGAEAWIGPFTYAGAALDLTAPPGPVPSRRFLEVEIRLRTMDRRVAPRVFGVDIAGACEPLIE